MKKKVTKTPKKTAVCVCKVGASTSTPKSVSCAAKETLIKASLESVIASPTILKKPNNPRLPAIGTTFIKKFKGKDLMIEVKSDGLYREGKCYKSLSGLAMTITEYPISGYIFFHKEIAEWATKKPPPPRRISKNPPRRLSQRLARGACSNGRYTGPAPRHKRNSTRRGRYRNHNGSLGQREPFRGGFRGRYLP